MKIKIILLFLSICIASSSYAQTKKPIQKKVNKPTPTIRRETIPESLKVAEPYPKYAADQQNGPYIAEAPRAIRILLASGKTITAYKISEIATVDFKID